MILLLEPFPHARSLLSRELSSFDRVVAPDLGRVSVSDAIGEGVVGGCRLLVSACDLPGVSSGAVAKLVRIYLPHVPVLFMTRTSSADIPPLDGALSVPYEELSDLLGPTVSVLLEESGEGLVLR